MKITIEVNFHSKWMGQSPFNLHMRECVLKWICFRCETKNTMESKCTRFGIQCDELFKFYVDFAYEEERFTKATNIQINWHRIRLRACVYSCVNNYIRCGWTNNLCDTITGWCQNRAQVSNVTSDCAEKGLARFVWISNQKVNICAMFELTSRLVHRYNGLTWITGKEQHFETWKNVIHTKWKRQFLYETTKFK